MATTVAEILSSRPGVTLAALPPTATVRDALQLMAERRIGSVLAVQGDALLGIFTGRDDARKLALHGHITVAVIFTGKRFTDVAVSYRGVPVEDEREAFVDEMREAAEKAAKMLSRVVTAPTRPWNSGRRRGNAYPTIPPVTASTWNIAVVSGTSMVQ